MALTNKKTLKIIIVAICIVVPSLVGTLYLLPNNIKEMGIDTSFLPTLNAILNSLTSVALILALVAVLKKDYFRHKQLMLFSMTMGAIFLISYVVYHATTASVIYGDLNHNGVLSISEDELISGTKTLYLSILLSHILLSIIVLPFVLFAAYFALIEESVKHKKVVKFAYPLWLYVSISGVVVYFMISPYYV